MAQATMDSVSFAGHITFAILAEGRPSISLVAPAFLACLVFVQEAVSSLSIIDAKPVAHFHELYSNSLHLFIKSKVLKIIHHRLLQYQLLLLHRPQI